MFEKMREFGEILGQFFLHGWGLVLISFATIIGGLSAIDYFCEGCIKQHFRGCLRGRFPPLFRKPSLRIVLLYKHDTEPDESAIKTLETLLVTTGHQVFFDRNKDFKQLEMELKQAEAVIILLTPAAVLSDMLCYEVETAYLIAQDRKLHLIPLWIQFKEKESLSEQHLANLLGNLPPIHWPNIGDKAYLNSLKSDLLRRLAKESPEMPYGAMPVDSPFYVERQTDQNFQQKIIGNVPIVLLRGSRQVGKTSLLARGLQTARDQGKQVWLTDFQALGETAFQDVDTFYRTIAKELTAKMGFKKSLVDRHWDVHSTATSAFEDYLCDHLLSKTKQPVLWAIDEADRLLQKPFCSDIFGQFRSWFNKESGKQASAHDNLLKKLTLIIVYATEYHIFIKDPLASPFNVGEKLTLEDFTREHVADLNRRYGSPLTSEKELGDFYDLIGGHPYLTRFSLHDMRNKSLTFAEFTQGTAPEKIFADHLRRIVELLNKDPDLYEVLRTVLHGQPCPDESSFDRLRSGGILRGKSKEEAQLRCGLYRQYLTRRLLK